MENPPAHHDTTPSPTIPGFSFTGVTMSCVSPPLYTHSPRHTTTPTSARSPAPSPSIHGVTMSGVNPPLYTHSLCLGFRVMMKILQGGLSEIL